MQFTWLFLSFLEWILSTSKSFKYYCADCTCPLDLCDFLRKFYLNLLILFQSALVKNQCFWLPITTSIHFCVNYLLLVINLLIHASLHVLFLCLIVDFKIFCLFTDWLFYGLLYCHLCPRWNHVHQLLHCFGGIQWDLTLQEDWLGLGTRLLWQQILLLKQWQTHGCSWAWS